jgi:hypothetical protein
MEMNDSKHQDGLPTFTWRREINTRHVASADDARASIEIFRQ